MGIETLYVDQQVSWIESIKYIANKIRCSLRYYNFLKIEKLKDLKNCIMTKKKNRPQLKKHGKSFSFFITKIPLLAPNKN